MASEFRATVLLCDAALVDSGGKLNMLGAGWSMTSSPTAPQAVAVLIHVPWDRTNQKFHVTLQLSDSDGSPIQLPGPDGNHAPIGAEVDMEAGRPPGVPHGIDITSAFALSMGPMPLPPGRYDWRLTIDAEPITAEPFTVVG